MADVSNHRRTEQSEKKINKKNTQKRKQEMTPLSSSLAVVSLVLLLLFWVGMRVVWSSFLCSENAHRIAVSR